MLHDLGRVGRRSPELIRYILRKIPDVGRLDLYFPKQMRGA
jgi:hypothetical protein